MNEHGKPSLHRRWPRLFGPVTKANPPRFKAELLTRASWALCAFLLAMPAYGQEFTHDGTTGTTFGATAGEDFVYTLSYGDPMGELAHRISSDNAAVRFTARTASNQPVGDPRATTVNLFGENASDITVTVHIPSDATGTITIIHAPFTDGQNTSTVYTAQQDLTLTIAAATSATDYVFTHDSTSAATFVAMAGADFTYTLDHPAPPSGDQMTYLISSDYSCDTNLDPNVPADLEQIRMSCVTFTVVRIGTGNTIDDRKPTSPIATGTAPGYTVTVHIPSGATGTITIAHETQSDSDVAVPDRRLALTIGTATPATPAVTVPTDPVRLQLGMNNLATAPYDSATYTVSLASAPATPVTITPVAPAGLSVSPERLTFANTTPQVVTVSVDGTGSALLENVTTTTTRLAISHTITPAGHAEYGSVTAPDASVDIDNYPSSITLEVKDDISESDDNVIFTIKLDRPSATAFTVTTTLNIDAYANEDMDNDYTNDNYLGTFDVAVSDPLKTPVPVAAGMTAAYLTVGLINDISDEWTERSRFDAEVASASTPAVLANITIASIDFFIEDDDDPPRLCLYGEDAQYDVLQALGQGATSLSLQEKVAHVTTDSCAGTVQRALIVNEDEGNLVFTVTQSTTSSWDILATVATSDGTAEASDGTDANDYGPAAYSQFTPAVSDEGVFTFEAARGGDAIQKRFFITVPITDDTDPEPTESFTISLTDPNDQARLDGPRRSIEVFIVDNDSGNQVQVGGRPDTWGQRGAFALTAGGEDVTYTLVLSEAPSADVVVAMSSDNPSAVSVMPANMTFTASGATIWSTPQTVTLSPVDGADNVGAVITHEVTGDITATFTERAEIGTPMPTLSIAGDANAAEGDGHILFTANLTGVEAPDVVTVLYFTEDGTATGEDDFHAVAEAMPATLTIPVGQSSGVISVQLRDDMVHEGGEEKDFKLIVYDPMQAVLNEADVTQRTVGGTANTDVLEATGTITDDDEGLPVLSLEASSATVDEGDAFYFTVRWSAQSVETMTVDITTTAGTAKQGEDYQNASGIIPGSAEADFDPAEETAVTEVDAEEGAGGGLAFDVAQQQITIGARADFAQFLVGVMAIPENTDFGDDVTFTIALANPDNAELDEAATSIEVTILEDDAGIVISPSTVTLALPKDGSAPAAKHYTVNLSGKAPAANVMVTPAREGTPAQRNAITLDPNDAMVFTPGNYKTLQTITVNGAAGTPVGTTVTITHAVAPEDSGYDDPAPVRVVFRGPAAVTGVAVISTLAEGMDAYRGGETLRLRVSFDAPVRVTGKVQLKLTIGEGDVLADLVGEVPAEAVSALTFEYTFGEEDYAPEGIAIDVDDLWQFGENGAITDGETGDDAEVQEALEDLVLSDAKVATPSITASAGDDQDVQEASTVTLDGSGSSAIRGAEIASYEWQQGAMDAENETDTLRVELTNSGQAVATFTLPNLLEPTTLTFTLTVTTKDDEEATDEVVVNVAATNEPPVATANADPTVVNEGERVTLIGTGSDPEGQPVTFSWIIKDGAGQDFELDSRLSASTTFTAPTDLEQDVVLVFELTVSDSVHETRATTQVTVRAVNLSEVLGESLSRMGRVMAMSARDAVGARLELGVAAAERMDGLSLNGRHVGTEASAWLHNWQPLSAQGAGAQGAGAQGAGTAGYPGSNAHPYHAAFGGATSSGGMVGSTAACGNGRAHPVLAGCGHFAERALVAASPHLPSSLMPWNDFTNITSFEYTLGLSSPSLPDDLFSDVSVWGQFDMRAFEADPTDSLNLDGDLSAFYLGVDMRYNGRDVAGVAVAMPSSTVDFTEGDTKGEVELDMVNVHPYISWSPEGGNFNVWSMFGFGTGEADISIEGHAKRTTDTSMTMFAAGGNMVLATMEVTGIGDVQWSAKADVFTMRMSSDTTTHLDKQAVDATQLRAALEGRAEYAMSGSWLFEPALEFGLRTDGGDGDSGLGAEVGLGATITNPEIGLSADLRGRFLAYHEEEGTSENGFSLALLYDPGSAGGPMFSFNPVWGETASQTDALWHTQDMSKYGLALHEQDNNERERDWRPDRMNLAMHYGIVRSDWMIAPYGSLVMGDQGRQRTRLGLRLNALSLEPGTIHLDLFNEPSEGPGIEAKMRLFLR